MGPFRYPHVVRDCHAADCIQRGGREVVLELGVLGPIIAPVVPLMGEASFLYTSSSMEDLNTDSFWHPTAIKVRPESLQLGH